MRRLQIIAAALMTLGFAAPAAAQGRVMGVVQDTNGRPIKGATIRATNPETSSREWTAATDDKGSLRPARASHRHQLEVHRRGARILPHARAPRRCAATSGRR